MPSRAERPLWRSLAAHVVTTVLIAAITAGLLEGVVAWSLRFPRLSLLPPSLARYIYVRFDRNTIQMMPECAQYDERLTYTLRPGGCTFTNREFSNRLSINSAGLRDDDASLDGPQVIMLGDSVTMGWGVEQDETFAQLFEARTGRRTLNGGVSSYGTVRELRLLSRLDLRHVTDVVIQHSANDFVENERFADGGEMRTLSRDEYDNLVRAQQDELRYLPGKLTFNVLVQIQSAIRGRNTSAPPPGLDREADVFVKVLERAPVDLQRVRVQVISLDRGFADRARQRAAASAVPWVRSVHFADLSSVAEVPHAYYVLDDHPTRIGHQAIAERLIALLPSRAVD